MKLTGTRIFFSSLLLAFAGVITTTPAHAQPPAGTAQPAPGTAPAAAQPGTAPAGTAPAGTAPVGVPATVEVQTTVQTTTTTTPAAAPAAKPAPVMMRGERRVTAPVIGAAVIGGVAVLTGVAFAVLANKDKSDYDKMATQNKSGVQDAPSDIAANNKAVSGEKKAFAADISFGLGVLFGLASLALYFLPDEPAATATTATTKVVPFLAQRSAKSWMKTAVTGRLDF